ncbi:MAG: hypothetical protein COA99_17475 [Moraxellaceae bacterium]|nr:MAG: hypothetical protein COA99_17475 [Moraxellaceae bacterium]
MTSTLSVTPASITADGVTTAIITVQLFDALGNNLTKGGELVVIAASGNASISLTIDNLDGTYTATTTNTLAETVIVSATLNTITMPNNETITFTAGAADATQTTITASSTSPITGSSIFIAVQAKDIFGNNVAIDPNLITLSQDGNAIIDPFVDIFDGAYVVALTNNVAEVITITGTLNGVAIIDKEVITFAPGDPDPINSTITADRSIITANGTDTSILTIQTLDILGNPVTSGGHNIVFFDDNEAIISETTDNGDGTYTATISNTSVQFTNVNATLDSVIMTGVVQIEFVEGGFAQINDSDGRFINGTGPVGASIVVQDADGNSLCPPITVDVDGNYHCLITAPITDDELLTVITTDRAGNSEVSTIRTNTTDSDNDGISDIVEELVTSNILADDIRRSTDTDGDQLPDYAEILLGFSYLSDGEPVPDGGNDFDKDGISDAVEYYFANAGGLSDSRLSTDTDNDGIPDITELVIPNADFNNVHLPQPGGSSDLDNDGVTNAVETYLSTLSISGIDSSSDYDHDGYSDALEVRLASNPLRANEPDIDNDGVNNAIEAYLSGTIDDLRDYSSEDTDQDGLFDIFELTLFSDVDDSADDINDPQDGDADADGISDAIELYLTGDTTGASIDHDDDGDGVTDVIEVTSGSDPFRHSKPVIWIDVEDLGGGEVNITANIGGYQTTSPIFSWTSSDLPIIAVGRTITISNLDAGKHSITLTVDQSISTEFTSTITRHFSVTDSGEIDADADGISDDFDSHDGLMGSEEMLHTAIGFSTRYIVQSQYGVTVRAGRIADMGNNEISVIANEQLIDYVNQSFPITAGNTEPVSNLISSPNLFDIDIVNLPNTGDSVEIVIPLNSPLQADAEVLLFEYSTKRWFEMDTDPEFSNDRRSSAPGNPGSCPPPGHATYTDGLTPGHYCIQLLVTDGENNDIDLETNGAIPLLIGIGSGNILPKLIQLSGADEDISNGVITRSQNGGAGSPGSDGSSGSSKSGGGGGSINPLTLLFLVFIALNFYGRANAAPAGDAITLGGGTVDYTDALTTVTQTTERMAIEWDGGFNVGAGEAVNFIQPSSSSIVLNYDKSGNMSNILGDITANGQVVILNSAGILIGADASIDVGSFFASDLTTTISDFNDADGDGMFTLTDSNIHAGGIVNEGDIFTFSESGTYLVGQFISNDGNIYSSNGDTQSVIADAVIVTTDASGILGVQIENPLTNDISPTGELFVNNGDIIAANGNVYVDVFYSDSIKADTVNQGGLMRAVGVTEGNGDAIITLTVHHTPPGASDVDSVLSENLPETSDQVGPAIEIDLADQAKVSLNTIMPDCKADPNLDQDCEKYQAIKRYLGRLLIGGTLPDNIN